MFPNIIRVHIHTQAYHSQIREYNSSIGNMAILPLRTPSRGPAPSTPNIEQDVIDESLYYFKANVFFRTYEIKVHIYTFFGKFR